MESPLLHAARARLSSPLGTRSSPTRSLCPAFCADGHGHILLFEPQLASHEFSLVGNTSLKKVLPCVCVLVVLYILCFLWSSLLTAAFVCFLFFFLCFLFPPCPLTSPDMPCALLPVSIAPPPPPMPQLTPQIPLTGFVARVQENSKSGQAELLKGRAYFLLACMAGKSDSILFPFPEANTILHSSVDMLSELKGTLFNIL